MFKFATITLLGLALYSASARPQADSTTPVSVVSLAQSVDENGFNYAFELSNGIKEEATGTSKTLKVPKIDPQTNQSTGDEDSQVIVQQGKYSYTAPDGQLIQVSYIADENGYQPQGDHLPVGPSASSSGGESSSAGGSSSTGGSAAASAASPSQSASS